VYVGHSNYNIENGGKRYAFINSETQGGEGGGEHGGLFPKYDSSFYLAQNHSITVIQCCIAIK